MSKQQKTFFSQKKTFFNFFLDKHSAAANGKLQLLRSLRLAGATLEEKDTFGRQCIHAVCLHTRG